MRNKFIRFLSVILAVGLSAAMFTTTAFAGGGDEEGEVIPTEPTGEVVSEPDPKPLTPEGNMSLVDDIDGEVSEDKQFITVVSKTGNYFYIIIDRVHLPAEGQPGGAAADESELCLSGHHGRYLRRAGGVHLEVHLQVLLLKEALSHRGGDGGGATDGGVVDNVDGGLLRAGVRFRRGSGVRSGGGCPLGAVGLLSRLASGQAPQQQRQGEKDS